MFVFGVGPRLYEKMKCSSYIAPGESTCNTFRLVRLVAMLVARFIKFHEKEMSMEGHDDIQYGNSLR